MKEGDMHHEAIKTYLQKVAKIEHPQKERIEKIYDELEEYFTEHIFDPIGGQNHDAIMRTLEELWDDGHAAGYAERTKEFE